MRRGAARIGGALLFGALASFAPAPAAADRCDDALPAGARGRAESARHVVVFRPTPAPIAVGRHFALETVVCPRGDGQPVTALRVDALMPDHRHGMNYRASISPRGDGRFVAEGLMFHMPGRWRLVFDVETSAGTERLVADLVLE